MLHADPPKTVRLSVGSTTRLIAVDDDGLWLRTQVQRNTVSLQRFDWSGTEVSAEPPAAIDIESRVDLRSPAVTPAGDVWVPAVDPGGAFVVRLPAPG